MSATKLLLALAVVTLSAAGAASAQAGVQTFPLPGEEVYPEGVAYDPATGDFSSAARRMARSSGATSGRPPRRNRSYNRAPTDGRPR